MITFDKIRNVLSLPINDVENIANPMNLLKSVLQIFHPEKNHCAENRKVFREFTLKDKSLSEKILSLKKTPLKSSSKSLNSKLEKCYNTLSKIDPRSKFFISYFNAYISEIEYLTNMRVPDFQKKQLLLYAQNNPLNHLSKEEKNKAKKEYNLKRSTMIREWEINTGKAWPTSEGPLPTNNGKLLSNKPTRHQLHHIILISYGGPNEWWNAHPATNDAHLKIHHKSSVSKLIFELAHSAPNSKSRLKKLAYS